MATKNIVPRADNEGQIGTATKKWAKVIATALTIGAADVTAAGVALIDDANAAAQRTTLGTAAYSEGTWTPVLNSFTIVGSAPAVSGIWKRIGNVMFISCRIVAGQGGNTSVAGSSTVSSISNLPVSAASNSFCNMLMEWPPTSLGMGLVGADGIWPQTFSAQTNGINVSATYFV